MKTRFPAMVALGLCAALMAAVLLLGHGPAANAQFADETKSLFSGDPDAPATKDDYLIFDLGTGQKDPVKTGNSAAQSVEELCCHMTAEERRADGLCFEAQCPDAAE